MLNKAQEKGYKSGLDHANSVSVINEQKMVNQHSLVLMALKSDLHIMKTKHDRIIRMEKEAIEKDRLANEKLIQAQKIVVQVQNVLNTIADTAVRGRTDIEDIRRVIEEPMSDILEG